MVTGMVIGYGYDIMDYGLRLCYDYEMDLLRVY